MQQLLVIGTNANGTGGLDITDWITEYVVQYPKLWSSDTGRNMKGSNKGTLVGIFTKILVTVGRAKLGASGALSLLQQLNTAMVYCKYYDTATRTMKVESFYFGDIESQLMSMNTEDVKIKQFSIIGNEKR